MGIRRFHPDSISTTGGDDMWASEYPFYEKLSLDLRKLIDGRNAAYQLAY